MATLYNWSKYNNKLVSHTGYTTTYSQGSFTDIGTTSGSVGGWTSYSFDSSTGNYSVTGNYVTVSAGNSSIIYNGSGSQINSYQFSSAGENICYIKQSRAISNQTPYTYYTDAEGSLVGTFYDIYDAHTSGSKNSDGYWYERGSVYNYDPTVSMNYNNGTSITSNLQIPHNDKSDFVFNIIGNDQDTNDTIQYKVQLNGVDHSSYKGFLKNVSTVYTIPFKDLTLGNNTVTVFIQDSKGYSISQSFILRNKVPQNLSLHSVLDSETALGYGNTSFTDLRDLMPSGYTGALSMADYVDYLS